MPVRLGHELATTSSPPSWPRPCHGRAAGLASDADRLCDVAPPTASPRSVRVEPPHRDGLCTAKPFPVLHSLAGRGLAQRHRQEMDSTKRQAAPPGRSRLDDRSTDAEPQLPGFFLDAEPGAHPSPTSRRAPPRRVHALAVPRHQPAAVNPEAMTSTVFGLSCSPSPPAPSSCHLLGTNDDDREQ